MKTVNTFTATIYIGFKEGYSNVDHTIEECKDICQKYVDEIGLCVTVTPLEFIYTKGKEYGAAIGFINYPRFPDTEENIRERALVLAKRLLDEFKQFKVSIVFPDETVMIEGE